MTAAGIGALGDVASVSQSDDTTTSMSWSPNFTACSHCERTTGLAVCGGCKERAYCSSLCAAGDEDHPCVYEQQDSDV